MTYICAISDGATYTQEFTRGGRVNRVQPVIAEIPCASGGVAAGVYVKRKGGGWGTVHDFLLNPME